MAAVWTSLASNGLKVEGLEGVARVSSPPYRPVCRPGRSTTTGCGGCVGAKGGSISIASCAGLSGAVSKAGLGPRFGASVEPGTGRGLRSQPSSRPTHTTNTRD